MFYVHIIKTFIHFHQQWLQLQVREGHIVYYVTMPEREKNIYINREEGIFS